LRPGGKSPDQPQNPYANRAAFLSKQCDAGFSRKRESDIALRIAFVIKAGDARRNITFASLYFPIAHNVMGAINLYPATFPFSFMLAAKSP